ncbi:MAG: error-prone DNA polymerase, partial [Desulfuromonadales bacterium]|nr:error-prone DNA polymerase [Desulfuromonadales bacterium]NIS40614.1 error-prone DNA polymerase [Desulfuromonadales bacterium]
LTDTDALYGAVAFSRAAAAASLRPIFGSEITDPKTGRRAVLLAKDLSGFGELCRVISERRLDPDFSLADRLSHLSRRVLLLCPDAALLTRVVAVRGRGDVYAELTRFPGSETPLRRLLETARHLRVPVAATNRVFFRDAKDWSVHRLLAAIRTNTTVHTLPQGAVEPPSAWLKPPRQMARLFEDIPGAVSNTRAIAEQCDVRLPLGEVRLPRFPGPPGETQDALLTRRAWAGLRRLYRRVPPEAAERLREELRIIETLAFAPYFLVVWDIVREAKARGIPTVGRGSAANSLVCRALGITEVDPLRHRLYFERFLNPERTDYPDIDLDFPWNRRDEMLDYVFERYGREHVALISSHIHFRGRSVLREVGKALGLPLPEIDAFVKRLPSHAEVARLDELRTTIPECRPLPLEDEPYRSMAALGRRIDGFP